ELVDEAAPPGVVDPLVVAPAGDPPVALLPAGAAALPLPGVWSGACVCGAACWVIEPGEPCERVVSAWVPPVWATTPPAIRMHALNTAVFRLSISWSSFWLPWICALAGTSLACPA